MADWHNAGCVQVGDKLPDVTLFESNPGDKVKLTEVFSGASGLRQTSYIARAELEGL
jgi:hypothetical protein